MKKHLLTCILVIITFVAVAQAPVISSFSPASAPVGSTVVINGNNFSATPANNIVYFGATKARVTAASTNQLTVTIPVSASYQPFSIFNQDTRLTAYSTNPVDPTFNAKHDLNASDFNVKTTLMAATSVSAINFADIDGDSKPDMIVCTANTVSIYRNISSNGSISASSFAAKTDLSLTGALATIIEDVDGDGVPDITIQTLYGFYCLRNQCVPGTITTASFTKIADVGSLGGSIIDLKIADFDGDGRPDIIESYETSTISFAIFRNTSTGGKLTFDTPTKYNTEIDQTTLCVNDLNGDGKPDLVFLSGNSLIVVQNFSVSGTISFSAPVNLATLSGYPQVIKLADMDNDGKPDIVVSYGDNNYAITSLKVFRNISTSGDITAGSFAPAVGFAAQPRLSNFIIADMDGDGRADIVFEDGAISVLLNNSNPGNISFSSKCDLTDSAPSASQPPLYINVCDIDGDGGPDVVYYDINSGKISAYQYNSKPATAGGPAPIITSLSPATGQNGSNITINGSNFNSVSASNVVYFGATKGKVISASNTQLTVQVPAGSNYNPLSVLNSANNLTGFSNIPFISTLPAKLSVDTSTFRSHQNVSINVGATGIVAGDIDGDGKPDVAVEVYTGQISVYLNQSTGSGSFVFTTHVDVPFTDNSGQAIKLVDIDGDGKLDILLSYGTYTYKYSVFLNTSTLGHISFAPQVDFTLPYYLSNVIAADFNGDGKIDIAGIANYSLPQSLVIFKNTSVPGKVSFEQAVSFAIIDRNTISSYGDAYIGVSDIDGDGRPDLLCVNGQTSMLSVFRNISANGGVAFEANVDFSVGSGFTSSLFQAADLDGDGKPDIIGSKVILRNTSTAGKISFQSYQSVTSLPNFALGDVNGDGKVDIVAISGSNKLSIFQNTSTIGNIAFSASTDITASDGPATLTVTDFDGDGKPDIGFSYGKSVGLGYASGFDIFRNQISIVPIPTITASGSTTITTGSSVLLTANPGTGYIYQWQKNGVDISGANSTTYAATQGGSYTVTITLNAESQTSAITFVSTVFTLPAGNFTISANSATCRGSANGTITITAAQNLNYTATITGGSVNGTYPFTTTKTISNLPAGTYNVCFTVAGQISYSQCFTIVITEPKDLAVYAAVNNTIQSVNLTLDGGNTYYVTLNGVTTTTTANNITLALNKGINDITVTTDKPCQGTYQKRIDLSPDVLAYPNPFASTLNVNLGGDNLPVAVIELYNTAGVKVYSKQFTNASGEVQLTPGNLAPGMYMLKLSAGQLEKIIKVVKQ